MPLRKKVLNEGFIELIDYMGSDYAVLQSARVSTGGTAQKGDKEDRGLIRYLYRNKHVSPFESSAFTFHTKMPIFVARQFLRSRTISPNEFSQRYSEAIKDYYIPETFRIQGIKNHQGSGEPHPDSNERIVELENFYDKTEEYYEDLIASGISREQARIIIPVGNYTELYFTVNLRNLFHLLELRLHEHAQQEIRVYAEAIYQIMSELEDFKWSMEIFTQMNEIEYLMQSCLEKDKTILNFRNYLEAFLKD